MFCIMRTNDAREGDAGNQEDLEKKHVTAVTSVVHEDVLAVHLAVPWL